MRVYSWLRTFFNKHDIGDKHLNKDSMHTLPRLFSVRFINGMGKEETATICAHFWNNTVTDNWGVTTEVRRFKFYRWRSDRQHPMLIGDYANVVFVVLVDEDTDDEEGDHENATDA